MNASVDSVFPEKYRILSGSALKMIAVITMLIDHLGAVLDVYKRQDCYRSKYVQYVAMDNYIIYFIPQLAVIKINTL